MPIPQFPGTITQKPVCGGDFSVWVDEITAEAKRGLRASAQPRCASFSRPQLMKRCWGRDRSQTGDNTNFTDFARRLVSDSRLQAERENLMRYKAVFDKAEETYGISGLVIAAIWGMETDFGADQGTFNTSNALLTLAYDCRRSRLFHPQFIALLKLFDLGFADARLPAHGQAQSGRCSS